MTDIFGAVVAAGQVTEILVRYCDEVAHAEEDIQKLKNEILLVSKAMKQVEKLYEPISSRAKDEPEFQEWVEQLRKNTRQYDQLLRAIKEKLESQRTKSGLLKWPWRRKDIDKNMQGIKWYHEVLQAFLQVSQVHGGHRLESSLDRLMAIIDVEKRNSRFAAVMHELCPYTSEIQTKLVEELGKCRLSEPDWILKQGPYQEWLSSPIASSKWLWGSGRPGAGKTCIASFIADTLQDLRPTSEEVTSVTSIVEQGTSEGSSSVSPFRPGSAVAIFYCSHQNPHKQDFDSIFRCLCRQFLEQLRDVNDCVARERIALVEQMLKSQTYTGTSGYVDAAALLKLLLEDFDQSFIIIDALDENPANYNDLLLQLRSLSKVPSLKIFVTSRDGEHGHLPRAMKDLNAIRLFIRPGYPEIHSYVVSRLNRLKDRDDVQFGLGSALVDTLSNANQRDDIANKIVEAASGNFLCAQLHITMLRHETDLGTLKGRLNNLPGTLTDLFKEMMTRIKAEDERNDDRDLGRNALLWAIYARRPLTVAELSHALATRSVSRSGPAMITENSAAIPSAQALVEATCYFLSIDLDTTTTQVHKAVKDYCEDSGTDVEERYFGDVQFEMARICIRYLTLDNFKSGHCTSQSEWEDRVRRNPFLEYAAGNWGWHVKQAGEERFLGQGAPQPIQKFLRKNNTISCIGQALQPSLQREDLAPDNTAYAFQGSAFTQLKETDKPLLPALHILTYFNLEECAEDWLRVHKDVESPSPKNFTPLWLACRLGYTDMVNLFLRHNADPARRNSKGRYCLSTAAFRGHSKIVDLLLAHKAEEKLGEKLLRQHNWYGRSVLTEAVAGGSDEIFTTLFDHVKVMDDRSELLLKQAYNNEWGILHEAAVHNRSAVIRVLAKQPEFKALLKQQTKFWRDLPVHTATVAARCESLKTLLEAGADIAAKQKQGRTPLHLAVQLAAHTHRKIVDLLLSHGADPAIRDNAQRTALHAAADHGRPLQVRRLLEHGCNELLEAKDERGMTPLEGAWKRRREKVIEVLLEAGARQPKFICSVRNERLSFTHDNEGIYLQSHKIPQSARVPLPRLGFKITSNDQGSSQDFPWDNGTYRNSNTWFEVRYCRNGIQGPSIELVRNLRATKDHKEHEISWDDEHGDLGGGSRGREQRAQDEVRNFMRSLRPGDTVALIAKALDSGWINEVHQAEIKIYYIE